MPPIEREAHEALLSELNNPELSHERRVDILQELRTSNVTDHDDFSRLNSDLENATKENKDLLLTNSKLFRQAGITEDSDKNKDEEQKEFSETVTLSNLLNKGD